MPGPSNETEAEHLERRKVEALERIAELLARMTDSDRGMLDVIVHED